MPRASPSRRQPACALAAKVSVARQPLFDNANLRSPLAVGAALSRSPTAPRRAHRGQQRYRHHERRNDRRADGYRAGAARRRVAGAISLPEAWCEARRRSSHCRCRRIARGARGARGRAPDAAVLGAWGQLKAARLPAGAGRLRQRRLGSQAARACRLGPGGPASPNRRRRWEGSTVRSLAEAASN